MNTFLSSTYKTDYCIHGLNCTIPLCKFAHAASELSHRRKYKNSCKKYASGFCPYGLRCSFKHNHSFPNLYAINLEYGYILMSSRTRLMKWMTINS